MNKFLLGVATGVGLSMFFRSRRGKELVCSLKASASNMVDEAIDKGTQKAKDFANDLVSGTKSSVNDSIDTPYSRM